MYDVSIRKAQVYFLKRLAALCLALTAILLLFCASARAQSVHAQITHPGQPTAPSQTGSLPDSTSAPTPSPTPEPTEEPLSDLSSGSRGVWVERLQERLTELGYLCDAVDGKYGYNTQQAVAALETGLRTREQRLLDASAESGVTLPGASASASGEPTPAPTPETVVDGMAEVALLEEILSGDFELYLEDVSYGSKGEEARRVQTRLVTLNYLSELPDGSFGDNSLAALTVFQRANGLKETGTADRETQRVLFSSLAVRSDQPVYNPLVAGMTNDRV